jgi:hypothetical protein
MAFALHERCCGRKKTAHFKQCHRFAKGIIAMKKISIYLSTALSVAFSMHSAALPLSNLSFEDGLTGYITVGSISTVTAATAHNGNLYTATDGNYFARLIASGGNTGLVNGTDGAYLRINGSLKAGERVSFDWAFLGFDAAPSNDFAMVIAGTQHLLSDIQTVGDYGDSGWQTFHWTAPTNILSGSLYIGVANHLDRNNDSVLLVDNIVFSLHSVPEPMTLSLLGLGLIALGATRKTAR